MIQNDIINITGSLITQKIVTEIKKCCPFSILADETVDISARYTIKNESSCILMESFLGFVTVFDLTGEANSEFN